MSRRVGESGASLATAAVEPGGGREGSGRSGEGICVLKLGGSVLDGPEGVRHAADEVARLRAAGWRTVVVVSALRGRTDALFERAARTDGAGPVLRDSRRARREEHLARLVSTGELEAAALVALALEALGLEARLLDHRELGLHADGPVLESEPVSANAALIDRALADGEVPVVPGYVALHAAGGTALLGRGGSDYTALFLAWLLGAGRCRLVKDVAGIFASDPRAVDGPQVGEPLAELDWEAAARLGGRVVQPRALHFARRLGVALEVGAPGTDVGTRVGSVEEAEAETVGSRPEAIQAPPAVGVGTGATAGLRPSTWVVKARHSARAVYRPTSVPIYQTATFEQASATGFGAFDYTRTDNPTRSAVETQLAALEGAGHGLAFASGMAALSAVLRLVAGGGEILAGSDLYGGTLRWLGRVGPRAGVRCRLVDVADPAAVAAAIGPDTRLLLLETPSNPLLRIADIECLGRMARERGVLLAVDNTLLSPLLQNPLALGADLVVHSATKHLAGHGDATAGFVATHSERLAGRLAFHRNAEGTGLAPFEAWLLLRGAMTLHVRLEREQATARRLAARLRDEPAVRGVLYPGLRGHPGSRIHARQARGPGTVVCFRAGSPRVARRFVEGLELVATAVSFGGVATTASLPRFMSHASAPGELGGRTPIPSDLVRLSVGVEDPSDLERDIVGALRRAADATARTVSLG
ncbi:MAG: PLP-dependent transferase [Candidatus Palauibacterales bacterium]|nr:PLP-dependent transferase [Candidatus Palauibacterales bacterium]MDP2530077.1 PLP-dependent transferase [Candidatus Palauibacterales bacterium]MDP2584545.1 PLP-dependent transferase [Candidatus Palauibacterales bacterium]